MLPLELIKRRESEEKNKTVEKQHWASNVKYRYVNLELININLGTCVKGVRNTS